jgi:hypothetical protein
VIVVLSTRYRESCTVPRALNLLRVIVVLSTRYRESCTVPRALNLILSYCQHILSEIDNVRYRRAVCNNSEYL